MIDPITLVQKYPNTFKFRYNDSFPIYFNSYDLESLFVTTENVNVDHPDTRYYIKDKFKNTRDFKILNIIKFNCEIKYFNILKNFKINNSSWVKVEFTYIDRFFCTGTIHFSTALDMINTCNDLFTNLFTNMDNITFYFIIEIKND